MKKKWRKILTAFLAVVTATVFVSCGTPAASGSSGLGESSPTNSDSSGNLPTESLRKAKNIILLIGDGMGQNHIKVGEIYKGEPLYMQTFPYFVNVETRSANNEITDSAAAGTALATGTRTNNGIIGRKPNGSNLNTIADTARMLGKRTGVITTDEIYGATPMAFSAHNQTRKAYDALVKSAATTSEINLFMSYNLSGAYDEEMSDGGYQEVENLEDISEATAEKIYGEFQYDEEATSMSGAANSAAFDKMVSEAIEYLSQDEDGFFLMAEGARIDRAGHGNNLSWMIDELLAFDLGVKAALDFAKEDGETVVIVTADHETGGLLISSELTKANMKDTVSEDGGTTYKPKYYEWTTNQHVANDVACYIYGADISFKQFSFKSEERIKNTDIFKIMSLLFYGM